jgi:hypothetical protein
VLGVNEPEPPISLLRYFDIVAWECGKSPESGEIADAETTG